MSTPAWIWDDVGVGMSLFGLFGATAFIGGILSLAHLRRLTLLNKLISGIDLLAPPAGCLLGIAFMGIACIAANKHRLLRGECRYTTARVFENQRIKGDQVSRLEYWVAGERYDEVRENMSWRGGWRPLGSYWYVRYAVPDPSAYEYLDRPVPDSVCPAPAAGWAALPRPPVPAPTARPAPVPAPAPLTGPAASPVFQAAPTNSARPLSVEASKTLMLVVPQQ